MTDLYQPTTIAGQVTPYIPEGLGYVSPTQVSFPVNPTPVSTLPDVKIESGFPGVDPLTFNYAQETQSAYDALKPFYDKLLDFAGGDVDLAKRVLEYTYQTGQRQALATNKADTETEQIKEAQENAELDTSQNKRGIIDSGFGQTARQQQTRSQQLRQEAIDRALSDRQSTLTSDRGFGLEKAQRGMEQSTFDLERQRRQEAQGMAADKYGVKSTVFQSQLQKAALDEQRRIQSEQNKAMTGGGNGGSDGFDTAKNEGYIGSTKYVDHNQYLRALGLQ